jgi:hypothetical protein
VKRNTYQPEPQIEVKLELIDDAEDVSHNRKTVKLTPAEIAERQEEKETLAAELERKRANRDSGVIGAVSEDIEHLGNPRAIRAGARRVEEQIEPAPQSAAPTSEELDAATAAVAQADTELAALDAALRRERQQQEEENQRREAEHQAVLASIRSKRAAAERETVRLREEQERAALADRIAQAQRYSREQEAAERHNTDQRNETHRQRVEPVLRAVRQAHRELRGLLRDHAQSLAVLSRMTHNEMPAAWGAETQIAWNRLAGDAQKLNQDLHHAADSYGFKVPMLEQLVRAGWNASREYESNLAEAIRYCDAANVEGVVQELRDRIARVSARLNEFDLTAGLSTQRATHAEREQQREQDRARTQQRGPVPGQTVLPSSNIGSVAGQTHAER